MKKITTILLLTSSLFSFAQGPIIEGTYLPVRGTSVKEVWDTINNYTAVPYAGHDTLWDYSIQSGHPSEFAHAVDTFQIKSFHPDSTSVRYNHYFPSATHASYLRTPFQNLSDSLYSYYIVDTSGLHMIGGFNIKKPLGDFVGFDTTVIINPGELLVPNIAKYLMQRNDISRSVTYGNYFFYSNLYPIKLKETKYKNMYGYGYGKLKMPNGNVFNNVLLTREDIKIVDSIFVDFNHNGSYAFNSSIPNPNPMVSKNIQYAFLRNNTFATSALMTLFVDSTNSYVDYGWYTLPVDSGSISGVVFDSTNEIIATRAGKAFLYRENSNFAKNDILDTCTLDMYGHYHFNGIPYGEYRIAIHADTLQHPTAFTTYYGDSTNWLSAPTIHTTTSITAVGNIHLQYHAVPHGSGAICGQINLDQNIRTNNPIPGVDIIVKKNPGGIAVQEVKSSHTGGYAVSALEIGNYDLFVDIPGLRMTNGGNFNIINSSTHICGFDCTVGTDSIHPAYQLSLNVNGQFRNDNLLSVYPNPYSTSTTIKVNVSEKNEVLLEVYNLLGEKIQTIEKGEKTPGVYEYNFNAKNIKYSAGIYILKLNIGNKTSVLKIIEQ